MKKRTKDYIVGGVLVAPGTAFVVFGLGVTALDNPAAVATVIIFLAFVLGVHFVMRDKAE